MNKGAVVGLVVVLGVLALVLLNLAGARAVSCEVCVSFGGQTECRTGEGRTKDDAVRAATDAACAVLPTSSMADRIKCGQQEPLSLACD